LNQAQVSFVLAQYITFKKKKVDIIENPNI